MATTICFDGSSFTLKVGDGEDGESTSKTKAKDDERIVAKVSVSECNVIFADSNPSSNDAKVRKAAIKDESSNKRSKKVCPKGSINNKLKERGFRKEFDSYGEKIFFCNHCDYRIKDSDHTGHVSFKMRDHHNSVHLKKVLECTECTYTALKYKYLQQHRSKVHGLSAMNCSEDNCKYTTILEENMIEHCKIKHNIDKEPSSKEKICKGKNGYYGKARKSKGNAKALAKYWAEKRRVAGLPPRMDDPSLEGAKQLTPSQMRSYAYSCKFCDYHNKDYCTVQAHVNMEHFGKQMKCELCNFAHYNKRYIVNHMKKEHAKQREICIYPGCGFRSYLASNLQLHLFHKHHGRYDQERHSILIPVQ